MGAHRFADVDDVRPCLLRGRDDAGFDAALRHRAFRLRAARLAAPIRRYDRRGHADQQDGAGAAQGLRPDAGAALRHLDGLLRQRRRVLSFLLCGGARLRSDRAGRHLRAGLSADRRGAALRRADAAKEDPAHRNDRALRPPPLEGFMEDVLKSISEKTLAALPGAALEARFAFQELTFLADAARIVDILKFLRDDADCQFVCFTDITAADYPERERRFEVVY